MQDRFPEEGPVESKGCKFYVLADKPTCHYGSSVSHCGCGLRYIPAWLLCNVIVYSFHSVISDGERKMGSVKKERKVSLGR